MTLKPGDGRVRQVRDGHWNERRHDHVELMLTVFGTPPTPRWGHSATLIAPHILLLLGGREVCFRSTIYPSQRVTHESRAQSL
jgi:hypothetical protein